MTTRSLWLVRHVQAAGKAPLMGGSPGMAEEQALAAARDHFSHAESLLADMRKRKESSTQARGNNCLRTASNDDHLRHLEEEALSGQAFAAQVGGQDTPWAANGPAEAPVVSYSFRISTTHWRACSFSGNDCTVRQAVVSALRNGTPGSQGIRTQPPSPPAASRE